MRIKKVPYQGVEIQSYNDSGSEWVVESAKCGLQRFSCSRWTQKAAIESYKGTIDSALSLEEAEEALAHA